MNTSSSTTNTLNASIDLTGRVLISVLFIMAGVSKLGAGYEGTQGYMEAMGVPGMLLPLVILTEIGGGLLILVGYQTRLSALALAGFSIVSALLFHANLADQMQQILFMKNIAIAGGFLFLISNGAGRFSVDYQLAKPRESQHISMRQAS
ncbi:DoxX family protein [Alkalimarinus coralli]|uniref:DoxX family protein n=1 Tax=Alkalimarinus coralli TaxID=2935863 RepID=UPI00202B7133|nr:DoxX family protein [Alkalimarinus coralli]